MILIGSRALSYWRPDWTRNEKSDWDVVATPDEASELLKKECDPSSMSWKWGHVELHNSRFFYNDEIEKRYASGESITLGYILGAKVCSLRGLAAIKRSHLHRKLNFPKHIIQYQLMDHNFDENDLEFIRKRTAFTKQVFGDNVGSKNKKNDEFFKDAVVRVFKHDDIHAIVADPTGPMYLKVKSDASVAAYDPDLWEKLSHDDKILAIQEECYVIAIERFLVPAKITGKKYPFRAAFLNALEKACTTLDDGAFREYAIDHWKALAAFDAAIFDRFFDSQLWRNYDSGRS